MAALVKVVLSRPMVCLVKPQLVGSEPVGCFTSVAQDLNSGIPRTNNTVQRSDHLASLAQVIPWRYIIDETCNEHSFTVAHFLLPFFALPCFETSCERKMRHLLRDKLISFIMLVKR